MATEKRRLPVVKPPEAEPGEEPRPPWHWVGFGTVGTFGAWLPLAYFAQWFSSRLVVPAIVGGGSAQEVQVALSHLPPGAQWKIHLGMVLPSLVSLLAGSFAGGYLVGRYGVGAGIREATLGGFTAGLVASLLALSGAGPAAFTVVPFAMLGAWLGGRYGYRRRMKPINM